MKPSDYLHNHSAQWMRGKVMHSNWRLIVSLLLIYYNGILLFVFATISKMHLICIILMRLCSGRNWEAQTGKSPYSLPQYCVLVFLILITVILSYGAYMTHEMSCLSILGASYLCMESFEWFKYLPMTFFVHVFEFDCNLEDVTQQKEGLKEVFLIFIAFVNITSL